MSGNVETEPGRRITLDLRYQLSISPEFDDIVVSINPRMQVKQIVVEGDSAPYEFNRGLLTVKPLNSSRTDGPMNFQVQASGIPKTGFANLDAYSITLQWRYARPLEKYVMKLQGHTSIDVNLVTD